MRYQYRHGRLGVHSGRQSQWFDSRSVDGHAIWSDAISAKSMYISSTTGRSPVEARQTLERKQPIGRLISVDEVSDAVMFCVANGGVTGQGVNVDGGAVQS